MGAARKNNVLDLIRNDLDLFVGQVVTVRANRGRKRVSEIDGILEKTYPKVFVVTHEEKNQIKRVSYTYSDVLTETVELVVNGTRRIGVNG